MKYIVLIVLICSIYGVLETYLNNKYELEKEKLKKEGERDE